MAHVDARELPEAQYADFHFDGVSDVPDPPAWHRGQVLDGMQARLARLHVLSKLIGNHSSEVAFADMALLGDLLERETSGLLVLHRRLEQLSDVDEPARTSPKDGEQ